MVLVSSCGAKTAPVPSMARSTAVPMSWLATETVPVSVIRQSVPEVPLFT